MKKIVTLLLTGMLGTAVFCGCGSVKTNVANPWTDCDTMDQAAKIAGFSMNVPEVVTDYTIRAMDDMVEVNTSLDMLGAVTLRKSSAAGDISGVYGLTYDDVEHGNITYHGGYKDGNKDLIYVIYFEKGGYTYSAYCESGMDFTLFFASLISDFAGIN